MRSPQALCACLLIVIHKGHNLCTGACLGRAECRLGCAAGHALLDCPLNSLIIPIRALDILERIAGGYRRLACLIPQERNNFCTVACLARAECRLGCTVGNALGYCPLNSIVIPIRALDILEAILSRNNWLACLIPQEHHCLCTGAGLIRCKLGFADTGSNIVGYCPHNRLIEPIILGNIREFDGCAWLFRCGICLADIAVLIVVLDKIPAVDLIQCFYCCALFEHTQYSRGVVRLCTNAQIFLGVHSQYR